MLTGAEMAVVDANAAACGVPRKQLMESSGNAVARVVRELAEDGDRVRILAGRGNNGGDAFVAARFLEDYDLRVTLLGRPSAIGTAIARENWDALARADVARETVTDSTALEFEEPDVVVDAMLGTGISGDLREPEATAAAATNDADATVVAVDVPSGLDAETGTLAPNAVDADHVVTFHDEKPGLADLDATVTVADIGIPDAAETFVERGDLLRLERDPASHKGDHGEVLVVGGGPYTGAPALAAQAALRGGADLVRVACPESVADAVQGYSESLITRPVAGDHLAPPAVDEVAALAADHDAVVLGPGLGDADATIEAARELLGTVDVPTVVDADALAAVPGAAPERDDVGIDAPLVCTPHRGEFEAVGGTDHDAWRERAESARELARDLDATLLVKGPVDVVADADRIRANRTGNPAMTVGGTGDVLAGVVGATLCRLDPHDAAAVGAFATGRAGDDVAGETGGGLLATDLLSVLPAVMTADVG